ncbi:site-2 protease family protein [Candidatus Microgenomates bacterium]|nr:site-2 protease family protein [Candidatus Microgenomates bacterium]
MFGSIVVFILLLSTLILVHELGHFWVAKKNGIWVEEFGFGLPPRIIGKKVGDTIYSLNLLPFGGFVRLHGELTADGVTKPKRAFINKSKKVKTAVIVAGVIMNFLLAVVAFAIVYSTAGIPKETNKVQVMDVNPGSPAQVAGLIQGDVITKVKDIEISSTTGFINEINANLGKRTVLEVVSGEETKKVTIKPRVDHPEDEGPLGVVISSVEIYYPPVWQRPFYGIYFGFKEALFWGGNIIVGFSSIFKDLFSGHAPQDIAGPVGIFAITSEAAKTGIMSLLNLLGIISVNLAILNIIPFPALDGGRLLFILIEGVVGRKVLPKAEAVIHAVGMIVLIGLLLAITIHDIQRLVAAGSLSGFLESVIK